MRTVQTPTFKALDAPPAETSGEAPKTLKMLDNIQQVKVNLLSRSKQIQKSKNVVRRKSSKTINQSLYIP